MKRYMFFIPVYLMFLASHAANQECKEFNVGSFEEEVCDTTICEDVVEVIDEIAFPVIEPELIDLSTAKVRDSYSNEFLTAEFPNYTDKDYKEGLTIITCNDYGYELKIASIPLGIEPYAYKVFAQQLESCILGTTETDTIIDGNIIKVFECRSRRNYTSTKVGRLYILTNGEKTIFLSELSYNGAKWWQNHINFQLEQNLKTSLDERLSNFNSFFARVFEKDKMKVEGIAKENNVTVRITDDTYPVPYSYNHMASSFFKMLHLFTVFREYADLEYDFTLQFTDTNGQKQISYDFPYEEYSQWIDDAESDMQDFDEE